ncbi:MAG: MFS transporter, partial [Planctomycetaceae bacterium]|nr:MFS transporter [Planctomycetaceae bacterium]
MSSQYLTAPADSKQLPAGIPYIIGNEAAERFSFYGMKAILVVFMTKYLLDSTGNKDLMGNEQAKGYYHMFTSAVYFTPILGALIADAFWGKYKTILALSVVYCAGHLTLALDETRQGLALGLGLIALGSGGIKPCVSAHVGDQFGRSNHTLLEKVFGWFYFSINLGAFASTLLTPWLLENYGSHVAFGVPGILMALATLMFWMGRHVFVHIPAGGMDFLRQTFSRTGIASISSLFIIYAFVAMFWALFDQTGSAWVLQAERMDRYFLGFEWLPSQIQAINPIMIMVLIPVFNGVKALRWPGLYELLNRVFPLTPLRKISIGFFLTVLAFVIPAWIEMRLDAGQFVNIVWQLAAYGILTAAEVFVSITCLEFSYTQAPRKMKSLIMACFLMSVSLGNLFVAGVNFFIHEEGATFQPDVIGAYAIELTVSDGQETATQVVTLNVLDKKPLQPAKKNTEENAPQNPTANAGRLATVRPGEAIRLYGAADRGDARGTQSYNWSLDAVPENSKLTNQALQSRRTRNPTFVPDVVGSYELTFTLHVGSQQASDSVRVLCSTTNIPPQAIADDITWALQERGPVMLDGSDSFDPDGDTLSVQWQLLKQPRTSKRQKGDITHADRLQAGSKLEGASY